MPICTHRRRSRSEKGHGATSCRQRPTCCREPPAYKGLGESDSPVGRYFFRAPCNWFALKVPLPILGLSGSAENLLVWIALIGRRLREIRSVDGGGACNALSSNISRHCPSSSQEHIARSPGTDNAASRLLRSKIGTAAARSSKRRERPRTSIGWQDSRKQRTCWRLLGSGDRIRAGAARGVS
jgi:hypothetical protein